MRSPGHRCDRLASLIVVVVIIAAVCTVAAQQVEKMSLEEHIQQLTRFETVDCGTHTRATASPEAMLQSLACARDAAERHKPFRVIQRGPGMDSEIGLGVLGTADGSALWFDYDSAPCGGPDCRERFETKPCLLADVVVIHVDAQGRHAFRCMR